MTLAIKFRDFKISEYVSLTWVLLALLVCGAGLHYIQMRWHCQWELLGRFADAMLHTACRRQTQYAVGLQR